MQRLLFGGVSRSLGYFGQGAGGIFKFNENEIRDHPILYSDAATSCVICFCYSGSLEGNWTICYAHVDSKKGVQHYFKKVQEVFGENTNKVHLYATGAVNYVCPNSESNCGKELFDEFNDQLNAFNRTETYVPGQIMLQFHTPHSLFQDEYTFKHYYGLDTKTMKPIEEHIPLNKENNDFFGAQCAIHAVNRKPIYWMDNSFTISDITELNSYAIQYYFHCSTTDEDLKASSTTPDIEPEEYYHNSRAATQWIRNNFKQKPSLGKLFGR